MNFAVHNVLIYFFYSQNQICEKLAIPAVDFSHIPDEDSGSAGNGLPDRSLVRFILAAIATQSAAAERSTEPILSNICPADIRSEQWELINDINEEFNKVWIPICIHTTCIRIHICICIYISFILYPNLTSPETGWECIIYCNIVMANA